MRINKNTEIVFLDLLSTEEKIGKLDKFIAGGDKDDPNLQKYLETIEKIKSKLQHLGDLEEIILQTKAWKNLSNKDIKITENNGYIYVRAPFYRTNKKAKEIRAILGKKENWLEPINSKNPDDLYKHQPFMNEAYIKLRDAMSTVIHENAEKLKTKPKKECLV